MTDACKLKAILNLACVVMSRKSTPAIREHAERLLLVVSIPSNASAKNSFGVPVSWLSAARQACPEWREL